MEQPVSPWYERYAGSYDRWVGPLTVGVLTALAVVSAVWAVVLMPYSRPDRAPHPSLYPRIGASLVIAGPGLFYITLYGGRAVRAKRGSLIPALGWLAVVIIMSAGRPEGDNPYLLATLQGVLLAPFGMCAAAAGTVRAQLRPWPPAVTRRSQALAHLADS
ncbi:MAG: DUF6113 family protein [Mycobacteriales bacterium]